MSLKLVTINVNGHVNSLPVLSEKSKLISKAKCLLKRIATPFDSLDPHNHALAPPPCDFNSLSVMIYMMHGESLTKIKTDIIFKGGIQNHVLILFYVQMVYVVKCLIEFPL
jgi:hypothetical protein